jgi:dolichyl-phosphate beta-glucosyltransferase
VAFFDRLHWPFEIVCVDDGSTDGTGEVDVPDGRVRILRHPANRGKGCAVKTGMLASKGRVRVCTDADLPYGLEGVCLATYYVMMKDYHVVVGDRTLEGSVYHQAIGRFRRVASQVFSFVVGRFITGGFYDTQCGFKAFRGEVADLLFPRLRIRRFACDVEMLYASEINNLDIKRIPVVLQRNEATTVRPLRDSLQTLLDVLHMKYMRGRGMYSLGGRPSARPIRLEEAIAIVSEHLKGLGG